MIYIVDNDFCNLDFMLDPASYDVGSTYADYEAGKWVELNDEQVAFKEANPLATISEVWNMAIVQPDIPVIDELEVARRGKLDAIKKQDAFSNKFYVSVLTGGKEVANQEMWVDKDLRNSLYSITLPALQSDGQTTTKLWSTSVPPQPIDVPIVWAMEKLPLLEIYAKRTYDIKASNEALVYAATTVEQINAIDVTAGYPLFLTFELNLDL